MLGLSQDLWYAFRRLRQIPVFSSAVITTLARGDAFRSADLHRGHPAARPGRAGRLLSPHPPGARVNPMVTLRSEQVTP